jgi:NAD(P)-dependent dehydrogenase (short-subunit alcohol dehydrogenase family)
VLEGLRYRSLGDGTHKLCCVIGYLEARRIPIVLRSKTEGTRTIIITGASAGIGRAIAHRFAHAGDRIGLIARDAAALETVRSELQARGAEAALEALDVADSVAVFAAAERLEQKLGKIDVWINDAMLTVFSPVAEMTPEEFRRVTEVTYLGCVHGTMAALKTMRPRCKGRIIQIGSALAYRGIPLQSAYCGAKHAIRGFTDSLRAELEHEGSCIRISIVELPAVNTPQFDWARAHLSHSPRPMGRPVQPEVVANAVFRATQGRWREYWLGAPSFLTILGDTAFPGILDRYLARNAVSGQQTSQPIVPHRRDNLERPLTDLHRTRGSFGKEAGSWAMLIPGEVARVGLFAVVGLAGLLLGAGIRWPRRRS